MAPRRPPLSFGTVASHFGVLIAVSAVMGVLAAGLALPVVAALGYGAHTAADSVKNIPLDIKSQPLAQRTRILDARGNTIATFFDQDRVDVPLNQIAPVMRRAIISIEDYRFYQHGAIDLKGTLRAFLINQADNGTTQGGSSITQQLAKMTELDQATTPAERKAATADTYSRKIKELRIAIAFEQHYTKDWILNRYLNIAYFGDGAYGIEAAAEHYFRVRAADLTLKQAALLAGLVKNPGGYDPTLYPTRAKARRNIVLARMAQLGVISQSKADQLSAEGLGLHVKPNPNGCVGSNAPLYCEFVYQYLLADPSLGRTEADRQQLINEGGLTIRTTMRPAFQRAAAQAARATAYPTDLAIASLAMVEPGTGDVLGIGQSRPVGRDRAKGQTFLNYAVPTQYGDAAGFQPGSSFKLFTLAAALTQGLPPTTTFTSPAQATFQFQDFRTCAGNAGYGPFVEHNSTGFGIPTFTMATGMQQSVNTYFMQLERQTGICQPYHLAEKMGMRLIPDEQVPTFTLGVSSASPLEMAEAYATVAARGTYCAPHPVTTIDNSAGKVFKKYPLQCKQVLTANVADQVNSILQGVMSPSGFGAALLLDKPSAGKTGTSENNTSVWFNGYTPQVATSAVVSGANAKGHPISLNPLPLHGIYHGTAHGSTVAGPMWALAMRAIQDLIPGTPFRAPGPGPDQAGVPSVRGQSVAAARAAVRAAGFTPVVAGTIDAGYVAGTVAGASLGVDADTVYLYLSTGHGGFSAPVVRHYSPPRRSGRGGGGNQGGGGGGNQGGGHGRGGRGGGPAH